MKKVNSSTIHIILLLTVTFLFSCTKEQALTPSAHYDPNATGSNGSNITAGNGSTVKPKMSVNTLVGNWKMVSLDYTGTSSNTVGGTTLVSNFSGLGKNFTYLITFNNNPKTYTTRGGYVVELTTAIDTTSFTQDVQISDVVSSGTWSLNGNFMTTIDDSTMESSTTEILQGSNNSFSVDYAGFSGQSNGGASVIINSGQVTFDRTP
tara:strand:- start:5243 stop:5863 length:621 start_codon:yes stop_codon:yes gene_type:complete